VEHTIHPAIGLIIYSFQHHLGFIHPRANFLMQTWKRHQQSGSMLLPAVVELGLKSLAGLFPVHSDSFDVLGGLTMMTD
jgi:hypothetical protein